MTRTACLAFCLALAIVAVPLAASEPEPDVSFRVQRLSDRVLILTEESPWESNHVVIVGQRGLVLVDPGHSALMGRLIRQAMRRELGRDRVDWVIDTHEHWGHTWGNAAFPEALVVGHELTTRAMAADAANLEQRAAVIRARNQQTDAGSDQLDPSSEEARQARLQREHFERIVRGLSETGFEVRLPDLTFSDRLVLDLGDLELEMLYLGSGHSPSDIVVLIPEERVLLLGCFFLEQGPLPVFGTNPELEPERWLEVFDVALSHEPPIEHVILGQHTVWPRQRLESMRDYIAGLWTGIKELDAEGVDLETAMDRLPVPDELGFLRQAGVDAEALEAFHQAEVTTLWRQLKESAAAAVEEAIDQGGAAAGVTRYRQLAARTDDEFFFDENEFNLLGYRLLGKDLVEAAIAVFELNVERFPESWNVYDSLGEAYAIQGDRTRAIELYRRSVEINPGNDNGIRALERLGASVADAPPTT
jgi:glyoxylase-like metal-dependent hydrolase (beta-lactamase superfamily II)